MSETIRCRTRPYYYIQRAVNSWILAAAGTAVLLINGILGVDPVFTAFGVGMGLTMTAWNFIENTDVVLVEADR